MSPPTNVLDSGFLKVSDIHSLYYEVCGSKDGKPGGPGGGFDPKDTAFFNPAKYKIVFFDQRGAGKSTPTACLEENTTWDLVKDIEKLREHLKIEKWNVFGGSWGSTLSLAYAQTQEKSWIREEYIAPIPEAERGDMILAYHAQLNSVDDEVRLKAAKAWSKWEMATSKLFVDPAHIAAAEKDDWANAFARIENHYFVNNGWMRDGQLLEKQAIDKIRHIPTIVVQGRYDVVCPMATAYDLKKVFPELTLHIVPDAGHSSREPATLKLLMEATDKFAELDI